MSEEKTYLGDSVYAEWDVYDVVLTTDNRNGASNTIVLESRVLAAFLRFLKDASVIK